MNLIKQQNSWRRISQSEIRNPMAKFPKTPSPKPARIPPQTPPAGGKSAEAGRILSPRQIVSPCRVRFNHLDFARNSFELCSTNTAKIQNRILKPKLGRAEGATPLSLQKPILKFGGVCWTKFETI